MELKDLYTQLILEESRNPEHRGELPDCTHHELGHNPSCGDEITLQLKVEGDVIKDASFVGEGCAISQASTSMLISLIKGKRISDVEKLIQRFLEVIRNHQPIDDELADMLGDAVVLQNIANMPARVKCAVLPWHTLHVLIEKIEADREE